MMALAQAPYDARAVANLILDLASEQGSSITQLVLLKVLYFSHGWFLAETGQPLIAQPVEAWRYGPVVKVVRDAFKEFGSTQITSRAERLVLETGEFVLVEPNLSDNDKAFVRQVYRAYVVHDAWTLSDMTHEEGSPWDALWNTRTTVGRLGLRIRNSEIRDHFLRLPKRFSVQ